MNVVKIGGSSLRSVADFERFAERLQRDHPPPTLVVVSALPGVTRQLEEAAFTAERNDLDRATAIVERIVTTHAGLGRELLADPVAADALAMLAAEVGERIERLLRGVALTGVLTPRTLDRIVSAGERLALHLLRHVLSERGLDTTAVAAEELVVTDDRFGNARPLVEETALRVRERLIPQAQRSSYVLTEGFVGATAGGDVTTMGKESSNLTAALLAHSIGARELVFYTPVAGIFTADPQRVPSARLVAHLSYDHAEHLAYAGLKLLYPAMFPLLRRGDIVLRITALDAEGHTTIADAAQNGDVFVAMEEPMQLVRLDFDSFARACRLGWQYRDIAGTERGAVLALAEPHQVTVLDQLGIGANEPASECLRLCVWTASSSASMHEHVERCIAALADRRATSIVRTGEESVVTAVVTSLVEQPLLASLHDAIAAGVRH
jgi:aspartate kinase